MIAIERHGMLLIAMRDGRFVGLGIAHADGGVSLVTDGYERFRRALNVRRDQRRQRQRARARSMVSVASL